MHHLRAGAVWVTISNWADAVSQKYGGSQIVTSAGNLSAEEARKLAWAHSTTHSVRPGSQRSASQWEKHAKTLVKDARWGAWSLRDAHHAAKMDVKPYTNAPFVWQHHDLFARNGFVAASRLGLPLVLFVDAPQVWEARRWGVARPGWGAVLQSLAERPQLLRAHLVACVTDEVAAAVESITRNRARVVVTPCTANIPSADHRPTNRRRHNLEGRLVIGWVGSFRRFHHVDMLVRATAAASVTLPELTLLLIGDGPTRAECAALASDLQLDCRFTGSVPNSEVSGLLQACDIGVIPSGTEDSFHYSPLKLKEYLAAGLPTIVPHAGEMARTMKDGQSTLFYSPGNEQELANQIVHLGGDPVRRESLSKAGQQILEADFSMADQLERIEGLL